MGSLGGMLGRRWAELGRKAKALVAQIGPRGWLASAAEASPDAVVRRGLGRKLAFALLRHDPCGTAESAVLGLPWALASGPSAQAPSCRAADPKVNRATGAIQRVRGDLTCCQR